MRWIASAHGRRPTRIKPTESENDDHTLNDCFGRQGLEGIGRWDVWFPSLTSCAPVLADRTIDEVVFLAWTLTRGTHTESPIRETDPGGSPARPTTSRKINGRGTKSYLLRCRLLARGQENENEKTHAAEEPPPSRIPPTYPQHAAATEAASRSRTSFRGRRDRACSSQASTANSRRA